MHSGQWPTAESRLPAGGNRRISPNMDLGLRGTGVGRHFASGQFCAVGLIDAAIDLDPGLRRNDVGVASVG